MRTCPLLLVLLVNLLPAELLTYEPVQHCVYIFVVDENDLVAILCDECS